MTATSIAALWGLGYAALAMATLVYGWPRLERYARNVTGDVLTVVATVTMWAALIGRAISGHGWPFVSPADRAAGIAVVMLPIYVAWKWLGSVRTGQFAVCGGAALLLAYGLGQYPQGAITSHITGLGMVLGGGLNLLGGGFLALAAAVGLGELAQGTPPLTRWLAAARRSVTREMAADAASEDLVRGALFCLATSLAIDTWWLQKVGLGSTGDAQQAGIAVAWMVYFVALRLRSHPRWRGWPWAAVLAVGFLCTLPILIQVSWLEATLQI